MKKPPIIILHGWNLSAKPYRKLTDFLKDLGYQVYLPDLPGFGNNKKITRPLTLEDYQRYLTDFIRLKKINQPLLIGHSFGGRVAILAAASNPKMFIALILTGVPGFPPVPPVKVCLFEIISKVGKLIFKLPFLSKFEAIAKKIIYRMAGSTDYYLAEGRLKETFKNIIKRDLEKDLSQIKIPTLLIWGKEDKVVCCRIAYKMHKVIGPSRIEIVDNSGHLLPYHQPKLFSARVNRFLQNL